MWCRWNWCSPGHVPNAFQALKRGKPALDPAWFSAALPRYLLVEWNLLLANKGDF